MTSFICSLALFLAASERGAAPIPICLKMAAIARVARGAWGHEQLVQCHRVAGAAIRHRVRPAAAVALAWAESRLRDGDVSRAGARGALQVIPKYHCKRGADDCDFVEAGVRALARLIRQHGIPQAFCHYASGNHCSPRANRYARGVFGLLQRLESTSSLPTGALYRDSVD